MLAYRRGAFWPRKSWRLETDWPPAGIDRLWWWSPLLWLARPPATQQTAATAQQQNYILGLRSIVCSSSESDSNKQEKPLKVNCKSRTELEKRMIERVSLREQEWVRHNANNSLLAPFSAIVSINSQHSTKAELDPHLRRKLHGRGSNSGVLIAVDTDGGPGT